MGRPKNGPPPYWREVATITCEGGEGLAKALVGLMNDAYAAGLDEGGRNA